ncbi:outer membrane beta-barrel protein [Shewanella gaetbuli]
MKLSTKLNYVTASVLMALSYQVSAADEKAGVIKTESGFDLTPGVNASLKYDDNIASTNTDQQESWILAVTPAIQAKMLDGNNTYTIEAGLEYGNYFDSTDDNYLDGLLRGEADIEFNQSNRLNVDAAYIYGHEDRGTGIFEGIGGLQDEPNQFDMYHAGGYYEYGARTTPARVRVNAKYLSKEYTNFEDVTQYRNYDDAIFGATFYYDTRASTSLLLDYQNTTTAYDVEDPFGDRDSNTQDLRLGVEWEATATTEGSVKVGYQKKSFDNADREDFSGIAWDAKITWTPLTYSQFDFSTGSSSKDPNAFGDYVRATTYGFKWDHDWSELIGTTLAYNRSVDDYTGIEREDISNMYTASVNFSILRWVTLKAGVDISDNSSTEQRYEYDRNVYFLTAEMTL